MRFPCSGRAYDGYLDHCYVTLDAHTNTTLNPGTYTNNGKFAFFRQLVADPLSIYRLRPANISGGSLSSGVSKGGRRAPVEREECRARAPAQCTWGKCSNH